MNNEYPMLNAEIVQYFHSKFGVQYSRFKI